MESTAPVPSRSTSKVRTIGADYPQSMASEPATPASDYNSETETELSLLDDLQNQNLLDDSPCPSQQSFDRYSVGKGAMSDLLGPSESEMFQVKKELVSSRHTIDDAEVGISQVLQRLQALWLNMDKKANIPKLSNVSRPGEHKLLQLISLVEFVVKEMESEWSTFAASPADANKLKTVQHSNKLLQEQLESSRVIQSCLESELKYLEKEKALLNDEIKELTRQVASYQKSHSRALQHENFREVGTLTTHQEHAKCRSISKEPSDIISHNFTSLPRERTSTIRFVGKISNTNIRKREHDFDSIMNFVRERGSAMDSLNNQMDKYNEDFQTLQEEIYQVANEKMQLHQAYDQLLEEHQALLKERQSYEGILNLILKEKKGTEESIHQILETLINKLNAIAAEDCTNSRFTVLESALHAVQGQNSQYRDEITELKCKLNTAEQNHLSSKSELETSLAKIKAEAEELRKLLHNKTEEYSTYQMIQQEKHMKLQELHDIVVCAKADAEKALAEKEVELATQKLSMETLQKQNFKHQKKIQELQRTNNKLQRELLEQKKSVEQLTSMVSQLRTNLKEQKSQHAEMMKASGDEAVQVKDHCRWLQSQIDNLNHQLSESHERIKSYEKDKTKLTQQVMSAEEERKVVDRKLEELRAALQGDTVLREALMERNEALQIEINRLRRAKLLNMGVTKEGDHTEPPSEMSSLEMSSYASTLPIAHNYEKGHKKNRYAAGLASNYPGRDLARNAISAHGSTLATSQSGSPASLD